MCSKPTLARLIILYHGHRPENDSGENVYPEEIESVVVEREGKLVAQIQAFEKTATKKIKRFIYK
ncbi:MAG: hypothetical protein U9N86_00370 [Bacteroidota bacterium]|nr:hypothetical protein [Bacteroidota bacterium]